MLSKTNIYEDSWVDMVFTGRNQEYGAFVLRKRYTRNTILALVLSISIFGLAIAGPAIYNYIKGLVPQEEEELKQTEVVTLVEPPPVNDEPPPPDIPPPPPLKETIQYMAPKIVEEATEDEAPPIQEQLDSATVSTESHKGEEGGLDPSLLDEDPGKGTVGGDDNTVYMGVEQQPEFPGGYAALTKFIKDNLRYPPLANENGITGQVVVGFIVEKDGGISDVKVKSKEIGWGLEEEAIRVVKMMPKFTPGRQNGNAVRVSYVVPIKFKLK